jgi:hypothetical protein
MSSSFSKRTREDPIDFLGYLLPFYEILEIDYLKTKKIFLFVFSFGMTLFQSFQPLLF